MDNRPKAVIPYYDEKSKDLRVIDMDGKTLKEGIDYEVKDGALLPLHTITIKEIKYINQPQRPNRAQRRHPQKAI